MRYLISFGATAMEYIPDEDMPAIAKAAHAVAQDAINAGVYVFAGGLENRKASIVAPDGTVTDGTDPEPIAGATIIEVPSREEALQWAAKIAVACRCAQEVWEFGNDPELDEMLRQVDRRQRSGELHRRFTLKPTKNHQPRMDDQPLGVLHDNHVGDPIQQICCQALATEIGPTNWSTKVMSDCARKPRPVAVRAIRASNRVNHLISDDGAVGYIAVTVATQESLLPRTFGKYEDCTIAGSCGPFTGAGRRRVGSCGLQWSVDAGRSHALNDNDGHSP